MRGLAEPPGVEMTGPLVPLGPVELFGKMVADMARNRV
jgi:hypothetical protein